PVHDSFDALAHMRDVEVQKQANAMAAEFQVRDQLGSVERQQFFNRFDLDDDAVFDKEVDAVAGVERDAAVNDRQANLVLKVHTARLEFMTQTRAVRTFKKTSTECAVNLHSGFENSLCDVSVKHKELSSVSSVSPVGAFLGEQKARR